MEIVHVLRDRPFQNSKSLQLGEGEVTQVRLRPLDRLAKLGARRIGVPVRVLLPPGRRVLQEQLVAPGARLSEAGPESVRTAERGYAALGR